MTKPSMGVMPIDVSTLRPCRIAAALAPSASPPPTSFAVILGGHQAGTMTVETTGASGYRVAFQYSEMGYGSAMAWVLFLIVLARTLLVFRSSGRWVYYEGAAR